MKKTPATSPSPAHDWDRSQAVEPYRHAASGRTVGRLQDAGDGINTHLFSATGLFIETVKTTIVASKLKKAQPAMPAAPAAEAPPAS